MVGDGPAAALFHLLQVFHEHQVRLPVTSALVDDLPECPIGQPSPEGARSPASVKLVNGSRDRDLNLLDDIIDIRLAHASASDQPPDVSLIGADVLAPRFAVVEVRQSCDQ